MPSALTFEDLIRYSLGVPAAEDAVQHKRNAIYFPSKEGVELVDVKKLFHSDERSTWEFNAPVALSSSRSSESSWGSEGSTCVSPCHSPAQDVAYRYRAGLKVDLGEGEKPIKSSSENLDAHVPCESVWSDDSDDDSETVSTMSSIVSLPAPLDFSVRARFRENNALLELYRDEAYAIIKRDGLTLHEPVVCHRPGCRDTLRDMRALVYHLHIHNIHDRSYECDACNSLYETRRELAMHICRTPTSPIKGAPFLVLHSTSSF
ncbi:hypothetical protein B0H10DRAFT_2216356 [Mycena sp. CBHHK59/15]|nr:hypothetical protein B0H10DRAFT_2216356 [Mycena sp. CBHHK59/15]